MTMRQDPDGRYWPKAAELGDTTVASYPGFAERARQRSRGLNRSNVAGGMSVQDDARSFF
jgi:hypothetical protein